MRKFKFNKYAVITLFAIILSFLIGLVFNISNSKDLSTDSKNLSNDIVQPEVSFNKNTIDYKYIEIDEREYLEKISDKCEKEIDIESLIEFKKINITDKERISELIKMLPVNEFGKFVEIEFKKTVDNSNIIEI